MDATTTDPLVGTRLGGRYRLVRAHARGGMSTVYVGHDERLERTVAVKVISADLAHDPAFVDRFIREARAAARLAHPNVVAVHDQGRDGDRVYLVMEFVEGGTLRDLLRERGRLSPGAALSVVAQLLAGLAAAHRAGFVHRDVKPENVLISASGGGSARVRVADFGLARAVAQSSMTRGGPMFGTVSYLSPEQISRGRADPRSDVYSVGILLYEALTGAPPYTGETAVSIAYRHVHEDIPAPSTERPDLPGALDLLVRRAGARDPAERPADAGALLDDVESIRAELGLTGEPVPVPADPGRDGRSPAASIGPDQPTPPDGGAATATVEPAGWRKTSALTPSAFPTGPATSARDEHRPRRSGPRRGVLIAAALLALALVGGAIVWLAGDGPSGPRHYTVSSSLVGEPVDDVLATLDQQLPDAVKIRTSEAYDDTVPEGSVAGFDPDPGAALQDGDTLTVVVSKGPKPAPLVDVTGDSADDAAATLADAGYVVADDRPEEYSSAPKGTVARTVPPAGTDVQAGDTITLVVSKGPEPVTVPDVVGDSVADATQQLEAAGFEVRTENFLGGTFGIVSAQTPDAGEKVPRGSQVTLTVV